MRPISDLIPQLQQIVVNYIKLRKEDPSNFLFEEGALFTKEDKYHWLNSRIETDGLPGDMEAIQSIGQSGQIQVPIVLDRDLTYLVEGKHRLSAGINYDLVVPTISLFRIKS